MIVAIAGRRVDADGATPARFPPVNAARVGAEIEATLRQRGALAVVCSAACGADLLAADAAGKLGIRARIILPFAAARFRDTSVVDRGGDWGPLFDRVVGRARAAGDLVLMAEPEDHAGYQAANREILNQAQKLANEGSDRRLLAMAVWDGQSRGEDDLTAAFLKEASQRHLPVESILTT